jgi:hypothetical protein
VGIIMAALLYARWSQNLLKSASIALEGLNLDSLNIANLRRRTNRSLTVQTAYHLAKIEGRSLTIVWQYDGFCSAESEASLEFSIDADSRTPFETLDCFAYDLREDPDRLHKIRPILIGQDGLSKKIAVPFLKPLVAQQPFSIVLNCVLPDCIGTGVQYYTSSLSFAQKTVDRLAVHVVFARTAPEGIRVYASKRGSHPKLAKQLAPFKDDGETCEYLDLIERTEGQSLRVYIFKLPSSDAPRHLPGPTSTALRRTIS